MNEEVGEHLVTGAAAIKPIVQSLLADRTGTSAIEMGLICSFIALAMMTALQNFAKESLATWSAVSSRSAEAIGQSAAA